MTLIDSMYDTVISLYHNYYTCIHDSGICQSDLAYDTCLWQECRQTTVSATFCIVRQYSSIVAPAHGSPRAVCRRLAVHLRTASWDLGRKKRWALPRMMRLDGAARLMLWRKVLSTIVLCCIRGRAINIYSTNWYKPWYTPHNIQQTVSADALLAPWRHLILLYIHMICMWYSVHIYTRQQNVGVWSRFGVTKFNAVYRSYSSAACRARVG